MIRYPYLVGDDAGNKPDASTAYQLAGTGLPASRTFAAALSAGDIADGSELLINAYEYDADGNPTGAWEVVWCTFTDATPDTLTRGTLVASSTGSKIDWSGSGENFSPRLEVVDIASGGTPFEGTFSGSQTVVTFGGASNQFRAGFDYEIELWGVLFDASGQYVRAEIYDALTAAWVQGTGDYMSICNAHYGSVVNAGGAAAYLNLTPTNLPHTSDSTSGAERTFRLNMTLFNPRVSTDGMMARWTVTEFFSTNPTVVDASGFCRYYRDITGIRFFTHGSANWVAGNYRVREVPRA